MAVGVLPAEVLGGGRIPGRGARPAGVDAIPPSPQDATHTCVDASVLAPGTLLAGRYRIVAWRGAGGMGHVYKALDESLGLELALKVLRSELASDPEWVARFRRELVVGRQVTHRNVVRIHDLGQSDGLHFITMGYVEGRSLREVLDREGPLPPARAERVLRQLAEALEQAHRAGVVHRDLKPANVLLDPDETAYITDFGIARAAGAGDLTSAGVVMGTPDYLSPEQLTGGAVDGRADLYAAGIVLFEMLTGEMPFPAGTLAERVSRRLGGHPRDLRETGVVVPERLRRVVERCLAREPSRRPASARALIEELDGKARPPRRPGSLRAAAVGLIAAAALASMAVGLASRRTSPAVSPTAEAAPAAGSRALAVLPLLDQTGDPGLAWASAGLAEVVAARLAESPELRVLDAARVFRAVEDLRLDRQRRDEDLLRRLATLLEVDEVVTGTLRRAGRTLRLDLGVARREEGVRALASLAAEVEDAGRLFEAAGRLADELRQELGASAPPEAEPGGPETTSAPAAAADRRGRDRLLVGDPLGAVPALEEAVAADPGFAAALERLSGAHQALGYHARALSAAERAAAALGPGRSRLALRVRARLALLHGVPSDAVTAYAELARRFPNDASALLDLAAAQAQAGDLARSIETLRRVAELDRGDPRVWLRLAQASILAGDSRKAVEDYLVRALALQTQLANELGRADVLNALGVACHELGDYSRALEHHAAAAELRRRLGDLRGLATSRRNRARVLLATARPAEAEPELAAAGALYSRIGDQAGQADVLTDMGALHEGRGDYASARRAYEEALRLRQNLGDARRLAQGYDDVGYVLFLQGEYDEARVYWREALDRRRQAGERGGVILSLQNLGFLHSVQGRWGEALKTFLETLGDSRQIGFRPGMAVSFGNLGLLHQYEGRYAAALESYAQARALMRDLGDGRGMAEYTLKEAGALIEVGDLGNARARLDEVEGWLRQSPNREQGAEHQVLLGEWALRRGDAAAARRAFALAVDRAGASQSRPALLRARLAQAVARVALGDPALPALTAAAREAEALGEALGRLRAAEALARAHMRARRLPEAERWATTALALAQRYNWVAGRHRIHAVLADVLAARGDAAGSLRHREEAERWRSMLKEGLPERLRAGFDGIPPAA